MLVVTAEGTLAMMRMLVAGVAPQPVAHLFQNNVVPDHTFSLASFVENSFPGYAAQNAFPDVSVAGQPSGDALITWQSLNWLPSGITAELSYGYYITDLDPVTALQVVLWCERGTPTVDWSVPSTALTLQPKFDFQTLFG